MTKQSIGTWRKRVESQGRCLGSYGHNLTDGLYWTTETVYEMPDGRYVLAYHSGAAYRDTAPRYLSREDVIEFLTTRATHDVSGHNYTLAEAEAILRAS